MLACTGTRTVRGHRMGSSVKLLCSGCLRANTDGLPICHTANTPPSLGQSPGLCVTALASCIPGSQRSLSMGLRTLSHTSLLPTVHISGKRNCPSLSNLCNQTSAIYPDYSIIALYHKHLLPRMGTDHVGD